MDLRNKGLMTGLLVVVLAVAWAGGQQISNRSPSVRPGPEPEDAIAGDGGSFASAPGQTSATLQAQSSVHPFDEREGAPRALAARTCGESDIVMQLVHPPLQGRAVAELQERLFALELYTGVIDGIFGPETDRAVRRLQRLRAWPEDGRVTDMVWQRIGGDIPIEVAKTPPPTGTLSVEIDTRRLRLTVLQDGQPYKSYPVAVGVADQPITSTPVGEWKIEHKDKGWGDGFGTRWLGLNVPWGIYGIHGTNKPWSIGTRASSGCIRMLNHHVEEIWEWLPLNTPVTILGTPIPPEPHRILRAGYQGPEVVAVQLRLKALGLYTGAADGRFGTDTEKAVRRLQQLFSLPVDGQTWTDVYDVLGLPDT